MSQDSLIKSDQIINSGKFSSDNGNITSDGASGNLTVGGTLNSTGVLTATGALKAGIFQQTQAAGTVQTLSTGNIITVAANQSSVRVTAAAAVTGIILAAGTLAGQLLTVIHEGAAANTITAAASGTSNIADGVSCVLTGPTARLFVWDAITALWYRAA